VKDWLIMVSGRVSKSGAKSTLPLFQGLQEAIVGMAEQIEKNERRWRISKMLNSANFRIHFDRAKTSVLELKNALRDFLDQEVQDAQEAKLKEINETSLATNEKLESMESQLGQIKELLQSRAAAGMAGMAAAAADLSAGIEETLFQRMQDVTGHQGSCVPFKRFVVAFETFMLKGADMPAEVKRGLKIAVDRENTGSVGKLEFIKFYRQWQASGLVAEEFLLKLADEAPKSLYAVRASSIAKYSAAGLVASTGVAARGASVAGSAMSRGASVAGSAMSKGASSAGSAMSTASSAMSRSLSPISKINSPKFSSSFKGTSFAVGFTMKRGKTAAIKYTEAAAEETAIEKANDGEAYALAAGAAADID